MKERPLTLELQNIITSRLNAMEMHIAEFSFPNLYLFRETHNYRVVETDHNIFISGLSYDKKRYLMPLNRPEKQKAGSFRQLKELLEENKMDFIFPIPEEWLECFPENNFTRTYNPDDSDYLFLTEKFKTYPGKSMHRKKKSAESVPPAARPAAHSPDTGSC